MAKQEECTMCKKAKQNGYGEIKCSFYGRKPQFDDSPCPHYSKNETSGISESKCQSASSKVRCPECGQEVSQLLSTCSNCGFPLKDDENRGTITSPNNGDTSTNSLIGILRCPDCGQEVSQTSSTCPNCGCPLKEQENENNTTPQKDGGADTGVLKEVSWCPQCGQKVPPMSNYCPICGCSFKEYVNYSGHTSTSPSSRPHKKNGTPKILLIVLAGLVLVAGSFFAIKMVAGSGFKYNIATTEDWVNFVASANDIKDIDDAFCSMNSNLILSIGEELTEMVCHLKINDEQKRAKCRAYLYIYNLSVAHQKGKVLSRRHVISDSVFEHIAYLDGSAIAHIVVLDILGDEAGKIRRAIVDLGQ